MTLLRIIIQFTWGLPQNIVGTLLFYKYRKQPHLFYKGVMVVQWNKKRDCMGIGNYIFLSEMELIEAKALKKSFIFMHEYGHTVQSMILGPFFLVVIGLPSLVWKNLFDRGLTKNKNYFSFYPEKWANYLGAKALKVDLQKF